MVTKKRYEALYGNLPGRRRPENYPIQTQKEFEAQQNIPQYNPNAWINPDIQDLPERPGQYVYQNVPNATMLRRRAENEARQKWLQGQVSENTELAGATPAEQRGMRASYESNKARAQRAVQTEQESFLKNDANDRAIQARENIKNQYGTNKGPQISPTVQAAIDRAMGNNIGPTHVLPRKDRRPPKDTDYLPGPVTDGGYPLPIDVPPLQEPGGIRGGTTGKFPLQPIKPKTPPNGMEFPMPSGLEPIDTTPHPRPRPQPIQPQPREPEPGPAGPMGPQGPQGPQGPGGIVGGERPLEPIEPGYKPPPPPGLDPNNFPMAPGTEPEPTIAGVKPSNVTVGGPDGDIPEGTVTAETKNVRPRIRDARDQVYTPRSILAPPPREPQLTPKWKGAQLQQIGPTKGYGEQLPPMYKNDPRFNLSDKRYIDENTKAYGDVNKLPDQYNLEQGPNVPGREYTSPAERYGEERPNNWKMKEAPQVGEYGKVQGGGRFNEDRPKGYDLPNAPDLSRPDLVEAPERYTADMPRQMDWRNIPGERNYKDVNIGEGFNKPLPNQKDIANAPALRERDMNFQKLGAPESVGRMRDRVWRPDMKEANYSDIAGPEKMAKLGPAELGKFNDLAEWDKGKRTPYQRQVYEGDRQVATRAGLADVARSIFTGGKGFTNAASEALGQERDRQQQFEVRQDNREQTYNQLQQADRQQKLAEQQFKFGLQKQISDQGIQVRGQDLDYIKEGARLGMDEFKTRLQERMGHNADKLRFNEQLLTEAQNFNQADQNVQAKNIEAKQADQNLKREFTTADNATLVQKAGIQQEQDRADFDRWAKTQDLTQDQYSKALSAWSLEQQAKYGQQNLGLEAQKFNVGTAQKQYDQAITAWTQEEAGKDKRFSNALDAYKEGRATLNDYQILKQKQQEFNSTSGQEFQKMLQQQYRDVTGALGTKAKFGLESWQAGQQAEEQYQQRQQKAQEFNIGTDIKSFDQKLNSYDKEMGYTKENFDSALDRWKAGQASDKDYQLLKFAKEKQDIDQGNTHFNQQVDVWKEKFGQQDKKLNTDLDRWKTGEGDHYKNLEEKRLRFGLNADEKKAYDQLGLSKWKIEQDVKDTAMNTNLKRWSEGKDLYKFESEEERQRIEQNNQALYRADANAINKYGHDITLWDKYNKLPSDIRKDEAMADNYMNWYAQEEMKIKGEKTKAEDPLKMANYYDNFNKDWTTSQAWKDYEEAGNSFDKIISAPPTGFGDMSAIYGFIKSIDPKTGVREGERDFAIKAMGWWEKAKVNGMLEGMPAGMVRRLGMAINGQLMLPQDREALAEAAFHATNVARQSYHNSLGQHEKTWNSIDALRGKTDRIMRLPDYFAEKDAQGNKLAEPGWRKKLREKYKGYKPPEKSTYTGPGSQPPAEQPPTNNPWGNFGPKGQPAPAAPEPDHTDDFNNAFPDNA